MKSLFLLRTGFSYPDIVLLAGAKPVVLETDESTQLKITPLQLREALNDKTRFVRDQTVHPTQAGWPTTWTN